MCSPPDVYVQALYDFEYETEDGKQIWMREGEEYLLLKKTNGDWWQVIRDGDIRPFYAPANYVEEISQPGLPLKNLKKKPPNAATSVNGSELKGSTRLSKYSSQTVSNLPPITAKPHKSVGSEITNSEQEMKKSIPVVLSKTHPPKYPPKPDLKMQDISKGPPPAPVQIHSQIIVPNPVYSLEHTTLLGKANYKKDYFVPEQAKDVATKNEKEKDNRLITEEQDKNRRNKDLRHTAKEKKMNELSLKSLQPQPPSPIYVNFPLVSSPSPPSPHLREFPLRCLDGNWAEYEDPQGRKYYYNYATKEKSWKPPRRRSDNSKPSSANSSKESSPNQDNRDGILEVNLHSPTPNSTQLPPGWSRKIDPEHNEVYYVNDITKEKWFTSTDDSGHIYYFQENASESFWQLPEVVITEADLGCKNKLTTNARLATSSGSLASERNTSVIPLEVPPKSLSPRRRPMSVVDRGAKTRSMVLMDTRTTSICATGDDFREVRSATLPKSHTSIILDPQKVLLQGNLSKTKVSEGGKKMRKNWTIFNAILTDSVLIFFKDLNKPIKDVNANKADSTIELIGSQIEWAPDKSTRKNVFQITTVCGQQYLLQDDDAQSAKKWFEAIQNGIKIRPLTHDKTVSLPAGISPEDSKHSSKIVWSTLSRRNESKGSVGSSSEDLDCTSTEKKTRIRDKLKFFFLRRPTMESLQEQGIIKDEPVFGCTTLTALCSKENTQIPKFVQNCIDAIENKDMTADGLYRASGNLSQIQKIRFQVNQDNLEILNTEDDIHVLTGALKMFFRELKEPLFPFNTFEKFLKAITLPDNAKKVKEFKDLIVNQLPKPNYYTLKALLEHLLRVTKLSDKNRMHIQNLAIVFGPTLMWSATDPVDIALDVIHQNQIIEFLLLEFSNIFR